jgi:hypothetical protein
MNMLPKTFSTLMVTFAPLFSQRIWSSVLVLVVGAILAPGKRTVSAVLQVMGLEQEPQFQRYHRVLNRAQWSSRLVSQHLLHLLVEAFVPQGTVVMGIDDTIERRWGKQIAARGIYRDPVRSSDSHFVKASGLRWLCLMMLVKIPWADRVWALPFLSVLAPSERFAEARKRRHKTLLNWATQMLCQVRRWLPQRQIVVVADSSFAALEFLASVSQRSSPVEVITRLRLDAALYEPAPERQPGQMGRPRIKGKRLATLQTILLHPKTVWTSLKIADWYGQTQRPVELVSDTAVWYHTGLPPVPIRWVLVRDPISRFAPQAFLCTDLTASPQQILAWFCQRWQLEVTFEEARAHLGLETQRQWSDLAIVRTTPALLGLFSLVVLCAHQLRQQESFMWRSTAWYHKRIPTFVDALAHVRELLWESRLFETSRGNPEMIKVPKALWDCWSDLLCYAA